MSNWYGTARSNYVRVKDTEAFRAWVGTLPDVDLAEKEGAFALFVGRDSDTGAWPSVRSGPDDREEDIDIDAEIAKHLAPGEVFIYCECGAEKLRYLTGWATAVNEVGDTLHISIDDIYALVKQRWNRTPPIAAY